MIKESFPKQNMTIREHLHQNIVRPIYSFDYDNQLRKNDKLIRNNNFNTTGHVENCWAGNDDDVSCEIGNSYLGTGTLLSRLKENFARFDGFSFVGFKKLQEKSIFLKLKKREISEFLLLLELIATLLLLGLF